jgi:hypothetical protein
MSELARMAGRWCLGKYQAGGSHGRKRKAWDRKSEKTLGTGRDFLKKRAAGFGSGNGQFLWYVAVREPG